MRREHEVAILVTHMVNKEQKSMEKLWDTHGELEK